MEQIHRSLDLVVTALKKELDASQAAKKT